MATIKVLGGDLEKGNWQFSGMLGQAMMTKPSTQKHPFKGESRDLKINVKVMQQLDEEQVKKLAGTAGWAFAGAVLLGPIGAIGGLLLGGNKKEILFSCEFNNGEKFLATTDNGTWKKLLAAHFK